MVGSGGQVTGRFCQVGRVNRKIDTKTPKSKPYSIIQPSNENGVGGKKKDSSNQKSHTKKQFHLYKKPATKSNWITDSPISSIALNFQPLHGKAEPHCFLSYSKCWAKNTWRLEYSWPRRDRKSEEAERLREWRGREIERVTRRRDRESEGWWGTVGPPAVGVLDDEGRQTHGWATVAAWLGFSVRVREMWEKRLWEREATGKKIKF